jgi:hypothetical protein
MDSNQSDVIGTIPTVLNLALDNPRLVVMARPDQSAMRDRRVVNAVGIMAAMLLLAACASLAIVVGRQQSTGILAQREEIIKVPERLPAYAAQEEAELAQEEAAADKSEERRAADAHGATKLFSKVVLHSVIAKGTSTGVKSAAEHRLKVKTAVAMAQGALHQETAVAEKKVQSQLAARVIPVSKRAAVQDPRRAADHLAAAPVHGQALALAMQAAPDAGGDKLEAKGVNVKGSSFDLFGNWDGVGSLDGAESDRMVPVEDAKVGEPLEGGPLLEAVDAARGKPDAPVGGGEAAQALSTQRLAAKPEGANVGAKLMLGARGLDKFVHIRAPAPQQALAAAVEAHDGSKVLELKSPVIQLRTLRDKIRKDSPQAQEPLFERIF